MKRDEKPASVQMCPDYHITGNEIKVEMATSLVMPEVTLNGANPDFLFLNYIAGKNKAEQLNLDAKLDKRRFLGN